MTIRTLLIEDPEPSARYVQRLLRQSGEVEVIGITRERPLTRLFHLFHRQACRKTFRRGSLDPYPADVDGLGPFETMDTGTRTEKLRGFAEEGGIPMASWKVSAGIGLLTILSGVASSLFAGSAPGQAPPGLEEAISQLRAAEAIDDIPQLEHCIAIFSRLQSQNPNDPAYPYYLGRAYFPMIESYGYLGDAKKAAAVGEKGMELVRQSIRLSESTGVNPDAHRLLGDYYGRLTSFQGLFGRITYGGHSIAHHKKALEMDPQSAPAWIGVGADQLLAPSPLGGDVPASVKSFTRAIELDPTCASAYVWRAKAHAKLAKYDLARQDFETALERSPNSPFAKVERARFLKDHPSTSTPSAISSDPASR